MPLPPPDPSLDVLHVQRRPLDVFFHPSAIAIIGATESAGSVGRALVENVTASSYPGAVYAVNPRRQQVLGIPSFPSVSALPGPVDLAVIATPAPTVPGVIRECADAGVSGAIIISAGFKEAGTAGAELERQTLAEARRVGMRLIGPNCLGVMAPATGLNVTFAQGMAQPGNVAFLSQSGALCTAILDWSLSESVGFSAFISVGSMLDVGWGDLIDHLGSDPATESIVLYMESVGDARSFLSAAREVAFTKPVVVIKAGRTATGARAAASHTGALTGSDEVLDAAFRRSGVIRVQNISDVFHMAEALAKQPRPSGPRLTILTNAGGPGVLATDALIGAGGLLAELQPETKESLDGILPAHWSHGNPIDVLGDAGPERYAGALKIASSDPATDGLLVVLTPQAMTDPTRTAAALAEHAHIKGKPVLASWMGGDAVEAGAASLSAAGIPTFPYPDTAARIFQTMWQYTDHLRGLYETPILAPEESREARAAAAVLIDGIRGDGRTLLTEPESKQLLAAYDIPTIPTLIASTKDEAAQSAESLGFPVVVKVYSRTITHKTDVGGVVLNVTDSAGVREAFRRIRESVTQKVGADKFEGVTVQPMVKLDGYELILGCSADPQFGPVLLFGSGGQLVEVYRDRALALPPLNTTLARRLMEQTRIYTALKGVRGRAPIDVDALERLLVRFSRLVTEQPAIREIDINPLLVSADRLAALDARVVLYDANASLDSIPRPAIRPYPVQYAWTDHLRDGRAVNLRPIRPEDEPAVVRFHGRLSEETVYQRYARSLGLEERTAHKRLTRICYVDYDRQIALVAETMESGQPEIVAVARVTRDTWRPEATFALLVSDRVQRQGLGTLLLTRVVEVAQREQIRRLYASILEENHAMQALCRKLGFLLSAGPSPGSVVAELYLGA